MAAFSGIKGHSRPIGILQRALATDHVHHAYLFTGPEGVGKGMVAQAFARALNCVGPPDARPCEACTHCTRAVEGNHPDMRVIRPDTSKARPIIKIEVVRDLLRQVHYRPYEARRRVIVVDDAEAMTEEAANAMLKTLEEPTGETIFILVTARSRQLLTTIISRCQLVRFAPLPRELVRSHLVAEAGMEEGLAEVCAAFCEGSIGSALALGGEGVLEARRVLIESVAELSEGDALDVIGLASRYGRGGSESLQALLESLKTFYRDVVLVRSGASWSRVVNVDLRPLVSRAASHLTVDRAIRHIEKIDAVQSGLRAYVDAHLLLEDLFFSLASSR